MRIYVVERFGPSNANSALLDSTNGFFSVDSMNKPLLGDGDILIVYTTDVTCSSGNLTGVSNSIYILKQALSDKSTSDFPLQKPQILLKLS
jgi:hypothetical protein